MKEKKLKEKKIVERRLFERTPKKIPMKFLNPNSKKYGFVETHDISLRGISFEVENEFPPRTPIEIWLSTANGIKSYYTRGEVVWTKMIEPNKYRIGINLEKLDLKGMSSFLKSP